MILFLAFLLSQLTHTYVEQQSKSATKGSAGHSNPTASEVIFRYTTQETTYTQQEEKLLLFYLKGKF